MALICKAKLEALTNKMALHKADTDLARSMNVENGKTAAENYLNARTEAKKHTDSSEFAKLWNIDKEVQQQKIFSRLEEIIKEPELGERCAQFIEFLITLPDKQEYIKHFVAKLKENIPPDELEDHYLTIEYMAANTYPKENADYICNTLRTIA